MSDLRVDYGEGLYERLDAMVDEDPIKLRDLAWEMALDVVTLQTIIAELRAHPAMLIDPGAEAHGAAAALRDMADRIDRGPGFNLPPSIFSALVRERADDLEAGR